MYPLYSLFQDEINKLDRSGWFSDQLDRPTNGGIVGGVNSGDNWRNNIYDDGLHVPGPSNYPDQNHLMRQQQQQQQLRNNPMGYVSVPSHTSISQASRGRLQRQHRSMDGLGIMDDYKSEYNYDTKNYHSDQHSKMNTQPSFMPLEISTNQQTSHQPNYKSSLLALSNPIPTQNAFWQQHQKHQQHQQQPNYKSVGAANPQGFYDQLYAQTRSGLNMSEEYEQLKLDYGAAIEKLNQTMNSIKTFWSPELKKERQLRREEASRLANLERMLKSSGQINDLPTSSNQALLHMEIKDREETIRQLRSALESNAGVGDNRVRELEDTIMRLQDLLTTQETQSMLNKSDPSSRFALENALRRIDEKQARIVELEEELMRQRMGRSNQPRDFTDKNLSSHEMSTLRMKMERSEVELAEKKNELMSCQTRVQTTEETANEMRSHLQLLKDQLTNREQQNTLLQGDVDALRQKLDSKNKQIEQKNERISVLERDSSSTKADVTDKTELIRQMEMKHSQLIGRIDGLETTIREKEQELDKMKMRILSHPDVIKEKEMLEKIEQLEREKQRLQEHIDQIRLSNEKEHLEQQKTYQNEVALLKSNIENLQKELSDRDILLESQNEKIGDMNKELVGIKKKLNEAMIDKGADELRNDVEAARNEVDKLLKMVHTLEKDNLNLTAQLKQITSEKRDFDSKNDRSGNPTNISSMPNKSGQTALQKRVEELEEALRESVSITAEREVHLSQQKQQMQHIHVQLAEARKEISELRKSKSQLPENGDRDQIIRAIESERRQHLEQLFQLKQEALLAAISEKDTHLALLEKSRGPREEIETIRRHKDALIRKLKQENERRAMVAHPDPVVSMNAMASVIPGAPLPAPIIPGTIGIPQQQIVQPSQCVDQDDTDGIWA